jgi:hypothetical protein
MNAKLPPDLIVRRKIPSAPEEQGNVQQKRYKEGRPHPEVFREKSLDYVVLAYPAPKLIAET